MKNEDKATERTCIVTRAALPAEAMIRFVVSPDGDPSIVVLGIQ